VFKTRHTRKNFVNVFQFTRLARDAMISGVYHAETWAASAIENDLINADIFLFRQFVDLLQQSIRDMCFSSAHSASASSLRILATNSFGFKTSTRRESRAAHSHSHPVSTG